MLLGPIEQRGKRGAEGSCLPLEQIRAGRIVAGNLDEIAGERGRALPVGGVDGAIVARREDFDIRRAKIDRDRPGGS